MDLSEIRCFQRVKTCEELLTSPDPELMVVLKSKLVSRLFPRHLVQIVSNSSRKRPRIFCYSKSRRLAFRLNNSRRLTISNGVFCYKNNRTLTDQASYIQKQIFFIIFSTQAMESKHGTSMQVIHRLCFFQHETNQNTTFI